MADMVTANPALTADPDDAQLVALGSQGNREAFEKIVERYQSLICSLAYNATGDLAKSEDLAQETFITAWKKISSLREPAKLKSWLCGIARHQIVDAMRSQGREPSHGGESIDSLGNAPHSESLPSENAISQEEQKILWKSVEQIPEIYRLPFILYYREHQSIDKVAAALELTEDAVRQRLARARKCLQAEVAKFVEKAFEKTSPGKNFTNGVMGMLPILGNSSAGSISGPATKALALLKVITAKSLVGSAIGIGSVLTGNYFSYRIGMDSAKSADDRAFIKTFYKKLLFFFLSFNAFFLPATIWGNELLAWHPKAFAFLAFILGGAWVAIAVNLAAWSIRAHRLLMKNSPPDFSPPSYEYKSKLYILGWPLVHVVIGGNTLAHPAVKAWFASGPRAIGLIFAFGGVAIAPICAGGLAVGILPWGGASLGLFAVGGVAAGFWAWGGLAAGWETFGGLAVAWHAAAGGIAIARNFALGSLAFAADANNELASGFAEAHIFFRISREAFQLPFLFLLNLLWVIPLAVQRQIISKKSQTPPRNQLLWMTGVLVALLSAALFAINWNKNGEIESEIQIDQTLELPTRATQQPEGPDLRQQSPEGHYFPPNTNSAMDKPISKMTEQ